MKVIGTNQAAAVVAQANRNNGNGNGNGISASNNGNGNASNANAAAQANKKLNPSSQAHSNSKQHAAVSAENARANAEVAAKKALKLSNRENAARLETVKRQDATNAKVQDRKLDAMAAKMQAKIGSSAAAEKDTVSIATEGSGKSIINKTASAAVSVGLGNPEKGEAGREPRKDGGIGSAGERQRPGLAPVAMSKGQVGMGPDAKADPKVKPNIASAVKDPSDPAGAAKKVVSDVAVTDPVEQMMEADQELFASSVVDPAMAKDDPNDPANLAKKMNDPMELMKERQKKMMAMGPRNPFA